MGVRGWGEHGIMSPASWKSTSGWFARGLDESGLKGRCILLCFCKGSKIHLDSYPKNR